jgi:CheY-like chemotaxis protein
MHKKSVLLVDDNVQIRQKVRKFLLEHSVHFEVYEASDGLDAIGKATETQPDLIILDWSMPRMNGVDVAQHLRKSESRLRSSCSPCMRRLYPLRLFVQWA